MNIGISMGMEQYQKAYEQELFAQKTPYLQWLREQEEELATLYGGKKYSQSALGKQIHTLPFSSCMDQVQKYGEFQGDRIYLFVKNGGNLSDYAVAAFAEVFDDDSEAAFVYADEDYRGSLEELYGIASDAFAKELTGAYCVSALQGEIVYYRGKPWFKPDFSPDTLASFFYIGSIFAIRGEQILRVTGECGNDISIYEMVYRIFMDVLERTGVGQRRIVHIPKVLYTNDKLADAERIDSSDRVKALYAQQGRAAQNSAEQNSVSDIDAYKISIVIPSKDNAKVLQKCLHTLIRYTNYDSYEIIIVDNGSNSEQKEYIIHVIDELKKEKKGLAVKYLYQEMEFNFSAMCNVGARSSDGGYLLFLNDDIEVMDTEKGSCWLEKMMQYARKKHVGAVGAKLYYPREICEGEENKRYKIQHAGITNMGIGPAHKLGNMVDTGCLYHGRNTQNYDMLAVTAACMLIRKSVFDAVGGFDETFPVAYNDVELCFRLYERGYFNVQVNEAVLLHHESLSRGQDTLPKKRRRLAVDKERLYQKHMLLKAWDPFYNPNLVQWKKDTEYNTSYLYAYDRQSRPILLEDSGQTGKRKQAVFKKYDIRNLLQQKCKILAKIYDKLTNYHNIMFQIDHIDNADCSIACDIITDDSLTIEGWCAMRDTDNAGISRKLWLVCMTRNFDYRNVYEFDIAPKLREDVAVLLEQTKSSRVELAGIQVNIKKRDLKPGTYRIGVLCENKLVFEMEKTVKIPDRNVGDTKEQGQMYER